MSSLGFNLQPRPVAPITPLYLFTRTTCPLGPCRPPCACRPLSLLSCCHRRGEPRLRDLDAVLRYPYCYRSRSDNRWKASPTRTPPPICTSAPCQKPRWSYDRGRREQLTNTPWRADGNEIDSNSFAHTTARCASQRGCCLPHKSNALIHCADSSRAATVTFSSK